MQLNLLIEVVLCVLPVALCIALIYRKRNEQREFSRAPFDDLPRRPAGETLRLNLQGLDEKNNEEFVLLLMFPFLMVLALLYLHPKDWVTSFLFFTFSAGAAAFVAIRLFKLLSTRANYQLGYDGERYVGEELSRLIGLGF